MPTLNQRDRVICLQSVDVCKHATTEMLAYIGSIAQEFDAPKGGVVFSEDDVSDAMYVIVTGRVRLDKAGNEVMTVSTGQSFETWALFVSQPRVMTATAVGAVER